MFTPDLQEAAHWYFNILAHAEDVHCQVCGHRQDMQRAWEGTMTIPGNPFTSKPDAFEIFANQAVPYLRELGWTLAGDDLVCPSCSARV